VKIYVVEINVIKMNVAVITSVLVTCQMQTNKVRLKVQSVQLGKAYRVNL
jgi:hypothetical protein